MRWEAAAWEDPSGAVTIPLRKQRACSAELLNASLGCGNPIALADLNECEVVLDLGSKLGWMFC